MERSSEALQSEYWQILKAMVFKSITLSIIKVVEITPLKLNRITPITPLSKSDVFAR